MKGMFSPSGTPIRPPTRECTRSALRMAHGGDVSPFTWTHAHAFPAPHDMPRPARRKGCSEMLRVPHGTPRPKLPDFTCTYMRLHLYINPGAAFVQVSPLACLVNKERAGLCAPKEVRRPGFQVGEGRERAGMRGGDILKKWCPKTPPMRRSTWEAPPQSPFALFSTYRSRKSGLPCSAPSEER